MFKILFTRISHNQKTGPIPVSTSSKVTCPDTCPLKQGGCYASGGPLNLHWMRVTSGKAGLLWTEFLQAIRSLPRAQLWRHNQAGDLPGINTSIDVAMLSELVSANAGKRGFTYTHKPTLDGEALPSVISANRNAIRLANANGFTINLSADNMHDADELSALGIGPVVTLLPSSQSTNTTTPSGRKIVVCPATQRDDVSCSTCKLCQRVDRTVIIGFPSHGVSKKKADAIANA